MQLPRHPADQSVFHNRMLLYAVAGAAFGVLHKLHIFLFDILAVAFFACYVVLFGIHWHARLLRDHELWREGRQQQGIKSAGTSPQ